MFSQKNQNLYKNWEKISNEAFLSLLEESVYNIDATLAINMKLSQNKLYIGNYIIEILSYNLFGTDKFYYNIIDNINKEILYKEVCLFTTVKTIIEFLLRKKIVSENLLILDTKYNAILSDVLFYKNKLQQVSDKRNKHIFMAKYDGGLMNLSRIRSQIENFDK